ncbi:Lrp/AsnC family transcriptional regulator, partial [Rhizobium johnstonii]
MHLDAIDRVLLHELQLDGRSSYASLARAVELTTASARARVLRLIEAGVVQIGVRQQARHDSLQIGFRIVATADARLESALRARTAVEYLATSVGRSSFVGTLRVSALHEASAELDALTDIVGAGTLSTWV